MAQNTDLSSRQLYSVFKTAYPSTEASLSTIRGARRDLGWTMKRTRYCQLISDVNKVKRMEWCLDRVISNYLELSVVIWTDDCSVQLQSHRKITYHKHGEPSKMVCRPKHSPKVHVWTGISAQGATAVVIFTGVLTATRYTNIWMQRCYHSLKNITLHIIVSNRTTIPSTPAGGPKTTFRKTTSTGGKRQPPAQT